MTIKQFKASSSLVGSSYSIDLSEIDPKQRMKHDPCGFLHPQQRRLDFQLDFSSY